MIAVGMLRYCNAIPFHYLPPHELSFCYDHPNQLYQLLQQKRVTAALTSSLHSHTLPSFSPFCIAATGNVYSVTLYHKRSLDHLNDITIAISEETSTSFALLQILCRHYWRINPCYTVISSFDEALAYEAFLIIGDQALIHQAIAGYQAIDLGLAWYEMTQLPFVFALFFTHPDDIQSPFLQTITTYLERSLFLAEQEKKKIAQRIALEKKLPFSLINAYYQSLCYRLGPEEKKGLEEFKKLSKKIRYEL